MDRSKIIFLALLSLGCSEAPQVIDPTDSTTSTSTGDWVALTESHPQPADSSDGSDSSSSSGPSTEDTSTSGDLANTSTGEPVYVPPPVARWDLNGDSLDQIGNLDGIIQGDLNFEVLDDREGLRFDGTGYLDLSSASGIYRGLLTAGTVTMTLRADTWDTPRNTLLALGVPSPDPTNNVFILRINNASAELYMEHEDSIEEFFQLGDAPTAQQWHQLTFVLNGSEVIYYADGLEQGRSAIFESDSLSDTLNFGIWAGGNYFYGVLDRISLYGEALTEQQVETLQVI